LCVWERKQRAGWGRVGRGGAGRGGAGRGGALTVFAGAVRIADVDGARVAEHPECVHVMVVILHRHRRRRRSLLPRA
jgi:hypothetical protein